MSTSEQTTALQLDALAKAGVERVFQESVSGVAPRAKRLALQQALAALGPGDVLVVWRLDRLARSVAELIAIFAEVQQRGADVKSLTEDLNTATPTGRLTFHIFAALAQFERELMRERVEAGRAAAKARGRLGGRPRSIPQSNVRGLQALIESGESVASAAKMMGVSRSAAYRELARLGAGLR